MQRNIPTFHHRDSRTFQGVVGWMPAGFDPAKPERVAVSIGNSSLWSNVAEGLPIATGNRVRIEAFGDTAATLLITNIIAKTAFAPSSSTTEGE